MGKEICVWHLKTRDRISSMTGHTSVVRSLLFCLIIVLPREVRIAVFDSGTHRLLYRSGNSMGNSIVLLVAFSHDGRWVASGSLDNTVRVWNSNTGQLIVLPLRGHANSVSSVSFTPDKLISGSFNKAIRIWSKSVQKEWPKLSEQIKVLYTAHTNHSLRCSAYHLTRG